MRRSLRIRIFLTIFLSVSTIYIVATTLILYEVQLIFTKNLTEDTQKLIKSSGTLFNRIFSEDIEVLRSIKNTLSALSDVNDYNELIENQNIIIKNIIEETPQFLSLGISWEIYGIDTTYKKNHGRYRYLYYWENGKITTRIDTMDIEGDNIGSLYYLFKISKLDDVTDIYFDSYSGKKEDEELMSSIGIPIVKNDTYIGLVACDIALERFYNIIQDVKPFNEAQTFLVSQNGKIVANSTGEHINKPLTNILGSSVTSRNLLFNIKEAKSMSFVEKDSLGNKNLIIIEPFYFGNINSSWSIGVILPMNIINQDANKVFRIGVVLAIIGLILMVLTTLIIINTITKPINLAAESLKQLSQMKIGNDLKLSSKNTDEIGQMINSINTLVDSLAEIKDFAYEISKGNLNAKLQLKGETDVLGQALLEMQRSLKIAKIEEEKRDTEEAMQKWSIEGESEISAILREYAQDIDQLTYNIVSYLVKYTDSLQGAIFVINDEDNTIELQAAYAYNRRKFLNKSIPFGVGLIGRSVQEAETIYINDIPSGYTSISSGLGEEQPRSLLIVPFKFNEVIYAVIELASFRDFKPYVRRFIERIGISVASTVANLRITLKTNTLVGDLQKRSNELSTQEEVMRQNLEEMQATQDEMIRKANEYESVVNALNQVSYVIEYDMNRRITSINEKFLRLIGKTKREMLGTRQGAFMMDDDRDEQLDKLWENLMMGRVTMFTQQVAIGTRSLWFSEAYIPIFDESGKPHKVINISNDLTNLME
ncbi:MAG: GAF domain-containing protein [Bacteroidales bacterium]|nr:GAF domain-containing protein [Bacteroidales bacterium]